MRSLELMSTTLHKNHVAILKMLRRNTSARFSELMRQTDLTSDSFKFYLRHLVERKYIEKNNNGSYQLTTKGKTFANSLNDEAKEIHKQPKLSIIAIISRTSPSGEREFLLQKRNRHPFFGFWGFISGPIAWGETAQDATLREVEKQANITITDLTVATSYRSRVFLQDDHKLITDTLFTVVMAHTPSSLPLHNNWSGGECAWIAQDKISALQPLFKETLDLLDQQNKNYIAKDITYAHNEY